VTPSGLRVRVHVPPEGNPFNVTLPVATEHVGCVIVPTAGADGTVSGELIAIFDDNAEVHPAVFVTE
jgi:hypothetical protein